MVEFAGTHKAKIDEKGRIVLPSAFKKEMGPFIFIPFFSDFTN